MRLPALLLAPVAMVLLVNCAPDSEEQASEEAPSEEETTAEETTEQASVDPWAECERELYATKGENATERWEAAPAEEKGRMCRQLKGLPVEPPTASKADPDIEARAQEAMWQNPEKDWSRGYTVMPDGSIRPAAEVERELKEALEEHLPALDAAGNPANELPESQNLAERNECLEAHYEGMSIQEKTARSREITAEAQARGVTIFDVVGC